MGNNLKTRKALRLPNYDYSTPGAYFITICTHGKQKILSDIVAPIPNMPVGAIHESPVVTLTECGKIVEQTITQLPQHLPAKMDHYVIMPNHIHLLISVTGIDRAIRESPLREGRSVISKVVGFIKMNTSKQIHNCFGISPVWQRSYYDHVIRNQEDYNMIAKYITENPLRWELDKLYVPE